MGIAIDLRKNFFGSVCQVDSLYGTNSDTTVKIKVLETTDEPDVKSLIAEDEYVGLLI